MPDLISNPQARALYKNIVVYYTKNKEFSLNNFKKYLSSQEDVSLISFLNQIELLAEKDFSEYTEDLAREEIVKRITILKQNQLKLRLGEIEQRIKVLEGLSEEDTSSYQDEQIALSEEFTKLTEQLKLLE